MFVYIKAQRLSALMSNLFMIGFVAEGLADLKRDLKSIDIAGFVFNNSVFWAVHQNIVFGIGTVV